MRKAALAVAALTLAATAPMAAQSGFVFGVNGGVTMPMGDAGDALKTGFGGGITLMMRNPSSSIGWGIDAQLHRLSYEDIAGVDVNANLNAYGAMARLEFTTGSNLYLLGGAGLFRTEVTDDDSGPDLGETNNTDFAVQGGLGLNFGRGFFIEGKFINVFTEGSSTQLVPITVGIRF